MKKLCNKCFCMWWKGPVFCFRKRKRGSGWALALARFLLPLTLASLENRNPKSPMICARKRVWEPEITALARSESVFEWNIWRRGGLIRLTPASQHRPSRLMGSVPSRALWRVGHFVARYCDFSRPLYRLYLKTQLREWHILYCILIYWYIVSMHLLPCALIQYYSCRPGKPDKLWRSSAPIMKLTLSVHFSTQSGKRWIHVTNNPASQ